MNVDRSKLPALGPEASIRFPPIRKHTRADGFRVWTVEHRDVPVLSLTALFPTGSAADPPDRHGLSALTADLLDEGTTDLDALTLHDALARIGSQLDTEVGVDATTVSIVTLARFADRALAILAGVVQRPQVRRGGCRARARQSRQPPAPAPRRPWSRGRAGASPGGCTASHPYGHTSLGSESAVAAMTVDELRAFHHDVFLASSPTLIAVGDISHDEVVALVERAWPATGTSSNRATVTDEPTPSATGSSIALVHRAGAAQSELRIGRIAAARSTPDYPALTVLNTALGGAFVSRINLKLREEKGFTYGARSSFDYRRQAGPFAVQASVQSDATAEAVADVIAEIAAISGPRPTHTGRADPGTRGPHARLSAQLRDR